MKYCPNCRAELNDNASFCPRCGHNFNMANNTYSNPNYNTPNYSQPTPQYSQPTPQYSQPTPQYTQPMLKPQNSENAVVTVFGFLTNILIVLTVFFLIWSIIGAYVSVSIYEPSYYYSRYEAYASFYIHYEMASFAMIFSVMAFGTGLTTFITTLVKERKLAKVLSAITKLTMGVFAVLLSAFALTW